MISIQLTSSFDSWWKPGISLIQS